MQGTWGYIIFAKTTYLQTLYDFALNWQKSTFKHFNFLICQYHFSKTFSNLMRIFNKFFLWKFCLGRGYIKLDFSLNPHLNRCYSSQRYSFAKIPKFKKLCFDFWGMACQTVPLLYNVFVLGFGCSQSIFAEYFIIALIL